MHKSVSQFVSSRRANRTPGLCLDQTQTQALTPPEQLRHAVLMCFCDPLPEECLCLAYLSQREWMGLLQWLDTSGLALYFLDRLADLDLLGILPLNVLARLSQNLADNSERIGAMVAESVAIQHRFHEAGVSYAVLKGFSLWPISVPKLESRSQLDLDFLVADESAVTARGILEDFGYVLRQTRGKNWDFKAETARPSSLKSLYKAGMTRSAELHLEHVIAGRTSLLSRTHKLCFHGVSMPVLPPVDLFLGQGLHVFQHLFLGFIRAAHLIELRRNVVAHHDEEAFWIHLQELASGEPTVCIRLGVVIQLITSAMGQFAPEGLTRWTVDRLPAVASKWVDVYGRRTALAAFPGTKLYLLLEHELKTAGLPPRRPLRTSLLPVRMPAAIAHAVAGEGLLARIRRYSRQLHFFGFRLCFHIVEGIRYLRESLRWRQHRNGLAQ